MKPCSCRIGLGLTLATAALNFMACTQETPIPAGANNDDGKDAPEGSSSAAQTSTAAPSASAATSAKAPAAAAPSSSTAAPVSSALATPTSIPGSTAASALLSIDPPSAAPATSATGALSITVNGSSCSSSCVLAFNGTTMPTTYVGQNQLQCSVSNGLLVTAGQATVSVVCGGAVVGSTPFMVGSSAATACQVSCAQAGLVAGQCRQTGGASGTGFGVGLNIGGGGFAGGGYGGGGYGYGGYDYGPGGYGGGAYAGGAYAGGGFGVGLGIGISFGGGGSSGQTVQCGLDGCVHLGCT